MTDIQIIERQVHTYYWDKDINCARCTLLILGTLFKEPMEQQTLQAAIGMHGAGGAGAQCGLVEGSLMFIGIHFARKGMDDAAISTICRQFAQAFCKEFSSLACSSLRPGGFKADDPPHLCEHLTVRAISFAYGFIRSMT
ncbi:MAG: C-GCAxxG-C-C family protein [Spirochaetia bacterium]|jgi:C_GCAxxG_C_C family probable redox protein|nr:C-GCAxxG-C-C family protein [Spirochaetia bacterium]